MLYSESIAKNMGSGREETREIRNVENCRKWNESLALNIVCNAMGDRRRNNVRGKKRGLKKGESVMCKNDSDGIN